MNGLADCFRRDESKFGAAICKVVARMRRDYFLDCIGNDVKHPGGDPLLAI